MSLIKASKFFSGIVSKLKVIRCRVRFESHGVWIKGLLQPTLSLQVYHANESKYFSKLSNVTKNVWYSSQWFATLFMWFHKSLRVEHKTAFTILFSGMNDWAEKEVMMHFLFIIVEQCIYSWRCSREYFVQLCLWTRSGKKAILMYSACLRPH